MVRKRFGALSVLLLALTVFGCASAAREAAVPGESTAPAPPPAKPPPNVVLVLADDLDDALLRTHLGSYPNIRRLYREGTSFRNSFVTNSVCCPSRSTGLTGRYSHNHGVMDNTPPNGGAPRFRSEEAEALPVWLQRSSAGYATGHIGKYMNAYDGSYVPPGWDEWAGYVPPDSELAVAGPAEGGLEASPISEKRYPDDRFAEEAASFIGRRAGSPYFLQVSLHAPHESAEGQPEYADRHAGLFPNARAPKSPSFDEKNVSDKPRWVRRTNRLTDGRKAAVDGLYRNRLRAMAAADEAVGRVYEALKASGELEDTVFVFTSDNGFHMGEHRLVEPSKRLAYEEDIRVPLVARGPGIAAGAARSEFVLNNDLAPTLADIAGAEPSASVDGRSVVPLLRGGNPRWRTAFLVEGAAHDRIGRPAFRAVRTKNYLYVGWANGERELYNVRRDPHQLGSRHEEAGRALLGRLRGRLADLRACEGAECREAEGG